MFELLSDDRPAVPHRGTVPLVISTTLHVIVVGALLAIPMFYIQADLPDVPDMLAFVVAAPPPPPPPPPPPRAATPPKPKVVKPLPTSGVRPAPTKAPPEIVPESDVDIGSEEGIPGGIEGGVPGGIPGGIVGGLVPDSVIPLPPPPSPPVERAPVRVGGAITAPALIHRVEPVYPPIAVRAQVRGIVILEAVVGPTGQVEDVRVLRSIPLLDKAAVEAVRRWRYSPLLLNGKPQRFVLTVTVSFNLSKSI
jgi:protein TonB